MDDGPGADRSWGRAADGDRGLVYWRVPAASRRAPLALLALLLLSLTACTTTTRAAGSTEAASASPSVAAAAADPTAPAPSDGAADPDAGADLVLEGGGLSLLQDDTPHELAFGTAPVADLRAALAAALGEVTETDAVACPQGARTELTVDGFTVLLAGTSFVGWTDVGAPDRALTTADGVGAGTRLADLRSALPTLAVAPGSTTWSSLGGLSGTLSGSDPAATVTTISAGQTCPH